ncbi:hypothetical protein PUN28_010460 [Cardiocondyla obscurior]|uniref:Uncharacterized protein n=1 Tax=Cardiocondyla obscurior TaxID=286306 RepID=A0AAW2FJJ5_9HYME
MVLKDLSHKFVGQLYQLDVITTRHYDVVRAFKMATQAASCYIEDSEALLDLMRDHDLDSTPVTVPFFSLLYYSTDGGVLCSQNDCNYDANEIGIYPEIKEEHVIGDDNPPYIKLESGAILVNASPIGDTSHFSPPAPEYIFDETSAYASCSTDSDCLFDPQGSKSIAPLEQSNSPFMNVVITRHLSNYLSCADKIRLRLAYPENLILKENLKACMTGLSAVIPRDCYHYADTSVSGVIADRIANPIPGDVKIIPPRGSAYLIARRSKFFGDFSTNTNWKIDTSYVFPIQNYIGCLCRSPLYKTPSLLLNLAFRQYVYMCGRRSPEYSCGSLVYGVT